MRIHEASLRHESIEAKTEYDSSSSDGYSSDQDRCLFDCLVEGCTAQYRYHANLLRHYATGKHIRVIEKYSLIDRSKILFH